MLDRYYLVDKQDQLHLNVLQDMGKQSHQDKLNSL
jgi:hypothetical protein